MTVTELRRALERLERDGHGNLPVYVPDDGVAENWSPTENAKVENADDPDMWPGTLPMRVQIS